MGVPCIVALDLSLSLSGRSCCRPVIPRLEEAQSIQKLVRAVSSVSVCVELICRTPVPAVKII